MADDTGGRRTENSADVTTIAGGSYTLTDSVLFQTPPTDADKTGGCLHEKRSNGTPGTTFEIARNFFINCAMYAIDAPMEGMWIHHNFIVHGPPPDANGDVLGNRGGIAIKNHGPDPIVGQNIVEFNTVIGTTLTGFMTGDYQQVRGPLIERKNIVVDDGRYNADRHMVRIGPYDSDRSYGDVVTKNNLNVDQNCYWNSAGDQIRFCLYCDNGAPDRVQGTEVDFGGWQSFGYDRNSRLIDAALDRYFRPATAAC